MKNPPALIFTNGELYNVKKFMIGGMVTLNDLPESEGFATGIAVGISIHQQKILTAYEEGEPLKINGELYFIQSGSEILEQMLDKICR